MNSITLNDLLMINNPQDAKVKFNIWNGEVDPLDEYLYDHDIVNNQWLFWRTDNRNFKEGQIAICLVKVSWDIWLLTTVKCVTKELHVKNGINYEGEELESCKKYFGRVLIKYHKTAQAMCQYYQSISDKLIVNQILPTPYDGADFPGYDNVRLTYRQLKSIIDHGKRDWVSALENQKAVYLLTDTNNGKLYVGSATSQNDMLLGRWNSYVNNGHGGNISLKELVNEHGIEYVQKYFTFTILENFNSKVDDNYVLNRESWWKDVLCTRKFGYNEN